jgi:starvation-inducible DNA-binding protein
MSRIAILLHETKNDLSHELRIEMSAVLNEALASAIDLSLQAEMAHWNVKGPNFIALHKLFDELYAEAGEWVDLIAERAVPGKSFSSSRSNRYKQ